MWYNSSKASRNSGKKKKSRSGDPKSLKYLYKTQINSSGRKLEDNYPFEISAEEKISNTVLIYSFTCQMFTKHLLFKAAVLKLCFTLESPGEF